MSKSINDGIRAGVIFGFVIIFLLLIGFTSTAAQILTGILDNEDSITMGFSGPAFSLIVFLGLIGLWAGANATKRPDYGKSDEWTDALTSGFLSGIFITVMLIIPVVLVSILISAEVDPRSYLNALSPETMQLFLLGQPAWAAIINYLVIFALVGLLGATVRRLFRSDWAKSLSASIGDGFTRLQSARASQTKRQRLIFRIVWILALVAFLVWLPSQLNSYWNFVLGSVGIFVLMGLGLNIEVGYAGLLDLGIVAFFAVGAYTVALLTAPVPHNFLWPFWATVPIGIVLAGLFGVLLGIPVLRLRGDYLAIVTLGLGEITRILIKSDLLTDFTAGPRGVRDIAGPTINGRLFNNQEYLYLIFVAIALIIFITIRLRESRVGRAMIAMREDETVAQAMGINTLKYKLIAFGIGAAFAGLGGVIFAARNQFTGPEDHQLLVSINVLSVVIVGGMGSIPGTILGAFALRGLPEVLRELDTYRILAFGGLLVAMMILRPEGLWPSKRRRLEFAESDIEDDVGERAVVPPPDSGGGGTPAKGTAK